MRGIYLNLSLDVNEIVIDDSEKLHHLLNVIRLKVNESILLLNGKGVSREFEVTNIQKRSLNLKAISQIKQNEKYHQISFLIGKTKKDDLSLIIKSCVEVGAERIIISDSQFSQKYDLNISRMNTIIEQAIEQSNNPFFPSLEQLSSIQDLNFNEFNTVCVFDNNPNSSKNMKLGEKILIVIGPEGGFSRDEIEFFNKLQNCSFTSLKLPIMRATTAINVAFGYVLNSIN